MRHAKRWAQKRLLLAGAALLCACATTAEPWKTYQETVVAGERERIAAHGRWDLEDGKCRSKTPPRLEIVERPSYGSVEFRQRKRRPSQCKKKFPHAVVYYRASPDYAGEDRFSYNRVDPYDGEKRLVEVEIRVKPGKAAARGGAGALSPASMRELQQLLAKAGYDPGPADGVAGSKTWSAISHYQSDRGLRVTGTPSAELLEQLRSQG